MDPPFFELAEPVERSPDGVPTAWRLFRKGGNDLTWHGKAVTLTLSEEQLRAIKDYFDAKKTLIPLDSCHFVSHLATKLNRDESELLNLLPHGVATMGFGKLSIRDDGLWLSEAEFVPAARDLLLAGTLKYFSPVIRGLDGKSPLRVTSVALANEPCLNDIPELTLAESVSSAAIINQFKRKEDATMIISEENQKVLLEVLELSETDTPETLRGKLVALKTQAGLVPALNEKVRNLELAEETKARLDVLNNLLSDGKLTNAMAETEHFKKMGSAELAEYGKAVPPKTFVDTSKAAKPEREAGAAKNQSEIFEKLGLSEEECGKKGKGEK